MPNTELQQIVQRIAEGRVQIRQLERNLESDGVQLVERLRRGDSTGDPLQDFFLLNYNIRKDVPPEHMEFYQKLTQALKSNPGQLVAVSYTFVPDQSSDLKHTDSDYQLLVGVVGENGLGSPQVEGSLTIDTKGHKFIGFEDLQSEPVLLNGDISFPTGVDILKFGDSQLQLRVGSYGDETCQMFVNDPAISAFMDDRAHELLREL